jgi:hypothetical protein
MVNNQDYFRCPRKCVIKVKGIVGVRWRRRMVRTGVGYVANLFLLFLKEIALLYIRHVVTQNSRCFVARPSNAFEIVHPQDLLTTSTR